MTASRLGSIYSTENVENLIRAGANPNAKDNVSLMCTYAIMSACMHTEVKLLELIYISMTLF